MGKWWKAIHNRIMRSDVFLPGTGYYIQTPGSNAHAYNKLSYASKPVFWVGGFAWAGPPNAEV